MKPYQRLALIMLLSVLVSCLVTPWVTLGIGALRDGFPGTCAALNFPFDRVMRRVVLVVSVTLLFLDRRRLEIVSLASMGLKRVDERQALLARGWLLGAGVLATMLIVMALSGARTPGLFFSGPGELAFELGKAFITGVVVAVIEEIFFRGFVLQSLLRNLPRPSAVISMSAFFAIVHFFNASDMPTPPSFDPLLGFKAVAYFFKPLLTPSEVLPGFIGLFLFGAVLGVAVLRTGSLYLAIGLHAGCVFGIKAEGLFLNRVKIAPWFFGDGRVVTGVFGWIALLALFGAVLYFNPKPQPAMKAGCPAG
jgi:membrane protease YdiL (CAAX protease family)